LPCVFAVRFATVCWVLRFLAAFKRFCARAGNPVLFLSSQVYIFGSEIYLGMNFCDNLTVIYIGTYLDYQHHRTKFYCLVKTLFHPCILRSWKSH
jgi:hypothetical protein